MAVSSHTGTFCSGQQVCLKFLVRRCRALTLGSGAAARCSFRKVWQVPPHAKRGYKWRCNCGNRIR